MRSRPDDQHALKGQSHHHAGSTGRPAADCGDPRPDHPLALPVASSDGVTVMLHDFGGEGPPLLLCHATGFHAQVWRPLARHLPGFHLFALDFRGHGDSSAPLDHKYRWQGFADDVVAATQAIAGDTGSGHILAAGHSKGGAALLLAEEELPGTFAALYCYEPVVFPPMDPTGPALDNPLADGALRRREVFDSFDAAYANFAGKPPFNSLAPDVLRAYVDFGFSEQADGSVRLKCPPSVESQVYRMGSQHPAFEHLGTVGCPVTVATGAILPFGPSAFASAVADRLPHGRLEHHADLGHFGPLENPALVADCIAAALAE